MKEKSQADAILDMFGGLEIGNTLMVPISLLYPSQPDDERMSMRVAPIEVCSDSQRLIIITGNHRYWDLKREADKFGNDPQTEIRKVMNPYSDF